MISRRSALSIATAYEEKFTYRASLGRSYTTKVSNDGLHDFLFVRDYSAWFVNMSKKLYGHRSVLEWVMKLHTGETLAAATANWDWEQRRKLGQEYLRDLAEDLLNAWHDEPDQYDKKRYAEEVQEMSRSLLLDGYTHRDRRLLVPESDVLDVREEKGVLEHLYETLELNNMDVAFHHLALSEEHFLAAKWDDAISNARKFLEAVMQQAAVAHSSRMRAEVLPESIVSRPVAVRDYLERERLLEAKEKEAIAKVYGLLSHTGGHPYMAANDQARLLRHLALTLAQFVMLRLQGSLSAD